MGPYSTKLQESKKTTANTSEKKVKIKQLWFDMYKCQNYDDPKMRIAIVKIFLVLHNMGVDW